MRVLDEGVSSFDVSLEKQEVLVTGSIEYDPLLTILKKTGKEVSGVLVLRLIWCRLIFVDRFVLESSFRRRRWNGSRVR